MNSPDYRRALGALPTQERNLIEGELILQVKRFLFLGVQSMDVEEGRRAVQENSLNLDQLILPEIIRIPSDSRRRMCQIFPELTAASDESFSDESIRELLRMVVSSDLDHLTLLNSLLDMQRKIELLPGRPESEVLIKKARDEFETETMKLIPIFDIYYEHQKNGRTLLPAVHYLMQSLLEKSSEVRRLYAQFISFRQIQIEKQDDSGQFLVDEELSSEFEIFLFQILISRKLSPRFFGQN